MTIPIGKKNRTGVRWGCHMTYNINPYKSHDGVPSSLTHKKQRVIFRLPMGLGSKFVRLLPRPIPPVLWSPMPMTYTNSLNLNLVNSNICLHNPTCSGMKSNEHDEHQLPPAGQYPHTLHHLQCGHPQVMFCNPII